MRRPLAKADGFIQNLAPGAAARSGFGAEQMRAKYPDLLRCKGTYPGGTVWASHKKVGTSDVLRVAAKTDRFRSEQSQQATLTGNRLEVASPKVSLEWDSAKTTAVLKGVTALVRGAPEEVPLACAKP
jgi:hypothetical protein